MSRLSQINTKDENASMGSQREQYSYGNQRQRPLRRGIPILTNDLDEVGNNEQRIALNRFDANNNPDCIYEPIDIYDFFSFIETSLRSLETMTHIISINNHDYELDIARLWATAWHANRYKYIFNKYLLHCDISPPERRSAIFESHRQNGNRSISAQCNVLFRSFADLAIRNRSVVEPHSSLESISPHNNVVSIRNGIWMRFIYNKARKMVEDVVMSHANNIDNQLLNFIRELAISYVSSLLYYTFIKPTSFTLSNYTSMSQYAAISYAERHELPLQIYQHGNYTIHGIPSPFRVKYHPRQTILYEQQFADAIGKDISGCDYQLRRLSLPDCSDKEVDAILIATSVPSAFDLDIYYDLWTWIKKLVSKDICKIEVKLHAHDKITPMLIKHLNMSKRITYVKSIDYKPKMAISLNSSIYYELRDWVYTVDYSCEHVGCRGST